MTESQLNNLLGDDMRLDKNDWQEKQCLTMQDLARNRNKRVLIN